MALNASPRLFDLRNVHARAVQVSAASLFRGEQFVARGIVENARDALTLMLQRHRDAEHGKAVREIRRPVQRIDIPAIVAAAIGARAFFAEEIVSGPALANALHDQLFGRAISLGDQVDIALVFETDAAPKAVHEQRAGFARNLFHGGNKFELP